MVWHLTVASFSSQFQSCGLVNLPTSERWAHNDVQVLTPAATHNCPWVSHDTSAKGLLLMSLHWALITTLVALCLIHQPKLL